MRIGQRRICWPEPDLVCLEGGCMYCRENPFRTLESIEEVLTTEEQWTAYRDGKANDFYNTPTKP